MFRILHYKNLLLIYIYPFWSFHFIINPASRNITPAPANIQPIQKYDFNPISTVRPSILSDKKPIVRLPITPISPAKIPPQIKLSTPSENNPLCLGYPSNTVRIAQSRTAAPDTARQVVDTSVVYNLATFPCIVLVSFILPYRLDA